MVIIFNYFVKRDAKEERDGKFLCDLKSLMTSYRELHNGQPKHEHNH